MSNIGECIHNHGGICSERNAFQNYICPYRNDLSTCKYGMVRNEDMRSVFGFEVAKKHLQGQNFVLNTDKLVCERK